LVNSMVSLASQHDSIGTKGDTSIFLFRVTIL
jgi:hypothetical protein